MPQTTAEAVVLEILRQADGEWVGRTKLFKAFYFAHLYYAKERPGRLTGWPIARMPQGPGIDNSRELFQRLVDSGQLVIEQVHEGPYPDYRYRLTDAGRAVAPPPPEAQRAIKDATLFCKDKTATELSQLTHELSRSWNEGKNGDILEVEIDLIPDEEYTARRADIAEAQRQLSAILGDGA